MPTLNPPELYGITRSYGGDNKLPCWVVFMSRDANKVRKAFYDAGHGGQAGALAAAQQFRDEWLSEHVPLAQTEQSERLAPHNTSGIPGVSRGINPRNGNPFWEAFVSYENRKITRSFAVNKYGEDGARDKAIAARQELLKTYQSNNYRLYSPTAKALANKHFGLNIPGADKSASAPQTKAASESVSAVSEIAMAPSHSDGKFFSVSASTSASEPSGVSLIRERIRPTSRSSPTTRVGSHNKGTPQMSRTIETQTPLGDKLKFSSMSGREELSRLYEFHVELLSETHTVSPNAVLGKPLTLEIMTHQGGKRYLDGHTMRFAYLGNHGRFFKYSATVRPTLWYATRGSDMKIFQKKNVPTIIKEVLGKYPIQISDKLIESYPDWDYCVQYRETDFNFVSRLMEHEGMYFFFEHSQGTHTLVLADSIAAHAPTPGTPRFPTTRRTRHTRTIKKTISTTGY